MALRKEGVRNEIFFCEINLSICRLKYTTVSARGYDSENYSLWLDLYTYSLFYGFRFCGQFVNFKFLDLQNSRSRDFAEVEDSLYTHIRSAHITCTNAPLLTCTVFHETSLLSKRNELFVKNSLTTRGSVLRCSHGVMGASVFYILNPKSVVKMFMCTKSHMICTFGLIITIDHQKIIYRVHFAFHITPCVCCVQVGQRCVRVDNSFCTLPLSEKLKKQT